MIESYLSENTKELTLSEKDQNKINEVLSLGKQIYKLHSGYESVVKSLSKTSYKNKNFDKILPTYKRSLDERISQFNNQRYELYKQLHDYLPQELTYNYSLNDKKNTLTSFQDNLGNISQIPSVNLSNIVDYIEQNNLCIYNSKVVNTKIINQATKDFIEYGLKENPGYKAYIIGRADILNLKGLVKEDTNYDMMDNVVCQNMQAIINGFMFQLPLLQDLQQQLSILTDNQKNINHRINLIEENFTNLIVKQNTVNCAFSSNISELVRNVDYLNSQDYIQVLEKWQKNPFIVVTDFDKLIPVPIFKEFGVSDGNEFRGFGYYDDYDEVIGYTHTYGTKLEETPKPMQTSVPVTYVNPRIDIQVKPSQELKSDEVAQLVHKDLSNNYVCILAKDINDLNSEAKVLCKWGQGFHPISQIVLSNSQNAVINEIETSSDLKSTIRNKIK